LGVSAEWPWHYSALFVPRIWNAFIIKMLNSALFDDRRLPLKSKPSLLCLPAPFREIPAAVVALWTGHAAFHAILVHRIIGTLKVHNFRLHQLTFSTLNLSQLLSCFSLSILLQLQPPSPPFDTCAFKMRFGSCSPRSFAGIATCAELRHRCLFNSCLMFSTSATPILKLWISGLNAWVHNCGSCSA